MIAIAFESVVKLLAFVLVGVFCTFELYDGFGNLFALARQDPKVASVFSTDFSQWGLATSSCLQVLPLFVFLDNSMSRLLNRPTGNVTEIMRVGFSRYTCLASSFLLFQSPQQGY